MNYSKAHHYFRTRCGTEDVFFNPEKCLGQNYAIILDFWWYLETMTREQLQYADSKYHSYNIRNSENRYRIIRSRAYGEIGNDRADIAIEATRQISREILLDFCYVAAPVTAELISLQTIFDNGEELIYLPMLSF
jgi:hypothetical protein